MPPSLIRPFSRIVALGLLCGAPAAIAENDPDPAPAHASDTEASVRASPPEIIRVGGEAEAEVQAVEARGKTLYVAGRARVDEALPAGYPRPTPPGAIEIKAYPSVRRAEISVLGSTDFKSMGRQSTRTFWPLFKHIQERDIAMTAPVEMDYEGMTASSTPDSWSMSFLYRTPDLGPTGEDGPIEVYDTEPVTVVSIGVRGRLDEAQLRTALDTLERWLGTSDEWRPAGSPRTFGYNGPMTPAWDRWWEVQLPVERAAREPTTATDDGATTPKAPDDAQG